ncbi:MAG: hypothetical protein Q8R72_09485 [Hylemonella sp.]|nr:hypothetical protein [Hylemonella sp.]
MTLNETKSHDTTSAQTPQQHHAQAAEHLEQAAKSHKDAATLLGSGDHKGAQAHADAAKTHAAQATEHVAEAARKSASKDKMPA